MSKMVHGNIIDEHIDDEMYEENELDIKKNKKLRKEMFMDY